MGDLIWVMQDGQPLADTVISVSDETFSVNAYASISAFNRIYPTHDEFTGGCQYNLKDSVLINGFITTSHGANRLDDFTDRSQRLLLDDIIMNELFMGADQLDLDFVTVLNEDDSWATLWHGLLQFLGFCALEGDESCTADEIDEWFKDQKEAGILTPEMEYALDMAVLVHEGEILAVMQGYLTHATSDVSKGQFFHALIERFEHVVQGGCMNESASVSFRLLLNIFSLATH